MSITTIVFMSLWGLSEVLAEIPSVKSNSVFQLFRGVVSKLVGKD